MNCPYCYEETSKYLKEGIGTCEHCHRLITYEYKTKQEIQLPGFGKLISEFAEETAKELKPTKELFYRVDSKEIIEIGKIKHLEETEESYTGFLSIKPNRFITLIEKHITPGKIIKNKKTDDLEFKPISATPGNKD
jgi:hypothetical protein